ncbi:MAG: peptidyl-prolyl cis-trans isomerase [Thermoguttaceae bacterium]
MAWKKIQLVLASFVLIACCVAIRYYWGAAPASADPIDRESAPADAPAARNGVRSPSDRAPMSRFADASTAASTRAKDGRRTAGARATSTATPTIPAIVANVNNQRVGREELAQECLRHYGNEVLESMVNKQLIAGECRRLGITVTQDEVEAEIDRMSKRFNIPRDQWLKMLKDERNVTPSQYANDIIWPTLALRKLAGERLMITESDLKREYETQYGAMVRVRLIMTKNADKAQKLQAEAVAHASEPSYFGNLAKTSSEDAASASLKGMINPIRKHGSYKEIEDAAFRLTDGEISPVIYAGGQYVILKRECLVPAQNVAFERVRPRLEEVLRDRIMRTVAKDIFGRLQKESEGRIQWVWGNAEKRRQMPGVAAIVLDAPITVRELAEECLVRHGSEVLDALISRKILDQACRRQNITVTDAEIDEEISRAAADGVKPNPDGTPDVQAWLELVKTKRHIPLDVYRTDIVWPVVAMKKLVGNSVKVTDEDLRKGFESNFGPRVRCLAIVLNNERRAQQLWELLRKKNTSDYFGDLASEYSIEPGSQALRGEIPPIRKHGGQPRLEDEAFALKPGEISGIIQVGDKFIILRCESFTDPEVKDFAQVRNEIYRDLHEKKLQLAMRDKFESLQEAAIVDNFVDGTSRSPKSQDKPNSTQGVPVMRQRAAG